MAPFSRLLVALLLVVAGQASAVPVPNGGHGQAHYDRVFSFGDSLTDTGNSAILPATAGGPFTNAPYGDTYFHRPSGRASDGRLVIDFIVESLGLSQPTPYLAGETAEDFRHGVNFAVGGATALDPAFLKSRGITTFVPVSLSNETTWFNNVLLLLASSGHEQRKITASSLFYFGEIGFNDYSFALLINGTVDLAESLVPHIVGAIRSAMTAVIAVGARTVVVTGMIPIGCEPELLALLPGGSGDYDPASHAVQRARRTAQPRAEPHALRAPASAPRDGYLLRRYVPPRHRNRLLSPKIRFWQHAFGRVLRRGRRAVQLQLHILLRYAGVNGMRQPVGVRFMGRDPLHGGYK